MVLVPSAALIASSAASIMPVPLRAEIATALQPICFVSISRSILSPFLLMISIMFTAITTGIPNSVSCVVR